MFPCRDCQQQYIGETSKKLKTRLTEHCNAIKRHDPKSLPATHADDYEHSFNWSQTEILGQAATRHACKFKEAWHSMDRSTLQQTHRYSHHLPSTQTNSKPSTLIIIFDDWNSPYKHSKRHNNWKTHNWNFPYNNQY